MSETTTVRVRMSTRDRLKAATAEQQASVDDVITAALSALERERWRREAEADARRLAADSSDRLEVMAAHRELTGE